MVRIAVGPQSSWSQSDVNAAVDDWMDKQSEWTADPAEHTMTGVEAADGSAAWWRGEYRLTFDSEPKANLLQKFADKLVNKSDWYRVGYHECDHDEADRMGCSWDTERQWTAKNASIPSAVPDFLAWTTAPTTTVTGGTVADA